ncbi:MAG: hlyA 9 [Phycisphaerales bacterium]|nr:hlyA 9 [Phycisphaerales bacterium]
MNDGGASAKRAAVLRKAAAISQYGGAAFEPLEPRQLLAGTPISSGVTQSGQLAAGQQATYTINVPAQGTLEVVMGATSGSLRPEIDLYGPDSMLFGQPAVSDKAGGGTRAAFGTLSAGVYTIVAKDVTGASSGGFNLAAFVAPGAQGADPQGGPIASGQTLSGQIAGNLHVYTIDAAAGAPILVAMGATGGNLMPAIEIYGPAGQTLDFNTTVTPGGGTVNSTTAPSAGTYFIVARDETVDNTGSFNIAAVVLPGPQNDPMGGAIANGQTRPGTINGNLHVYTFNAAAGGTIDVEAITTSGNLRPQVLLYDQAGNSLNPVPQGLNQQTEFPRRTIMAPSSGTYFAVVESFVGDTAGGYNFKAIYVPGPTTPPPGSIAGTVNRDLTNGKVGVPNVTVFLDTNGNGTLDAGEVSVKTDGSGNYHFDNLPAGSYNVAEVVPAGFQKTMPAGDLKVNPLPGESLSGADFLNVFIGLPPGSPPSTDTTAPTAVVPATQPALVAGQSTYDFVVNYADNTALNTATFGNANVRVTFPDGSTHAATLFVFSSLTSGSSAAVTYRITAPSGVFDAGANGQYTVNMVAGAVNDTAGNAVAAGPIGTFTLSLPVIDAPDLAPTLTATFPASVIAGSNAKGVLSATINNLGDRTSSGKVSVKFFLSTVSTLDSSAIPLTSLTKNLKLKAGAAKNLKVKLSKFPNVPAGTYFILAQVTLPPGVTEQKTSNNVTAAAGTVTVLPANFDLTASFARTLPATLARGKKVTLSVLVQNVGNAAFNGPMSVTLSAFSNGTGVTTDLAPTLTKSISLKAGKVKALKLTAVVPASLAAGNYFVTVRVSSNTLAEANPLNNIAGGSVVFT